MRIAVDGVYFGLAVGRKPDEVLDLALQAGADGLNWPLHPDYGADDPAATAATIAAAGLSVVSLGLTEQTSAVPGSQAQFRDLIARAIDAARVLGAPVLDCWPWRPLDVEKDRAQVVLASNLEAVTSLLAAASCAISIEFEPDTTLERYDEALCFIAPFGPAVRLTADTYHIIRIGDDLVEAAAALGSRIGVVHFSASHRGEPGSEGDRCDYAAFLSAAIDAGFDGDIVLQYKPPADAAASLKRAVALARRCLES
jgi:sugar phosphate isomerase/epimerase